MKNRETDVQKFKDNRAKEQQMIREKLRTKDLQKAKGKRAKEQQMIREKTDN